MIYRFGIVGAGMIAPYHVEAIQRLENARVVGIMDGFSANQRR